MMTETNNFNLELRFFFSIGKLDLHLRSERES